MIPYPSFITCCLVSTAAIVACEYRSAWALLALAPLAAAAAARYLPPLRPWMRILPLQQPPRIKPPASPFRTDVRLELHLAFGSMIRREEDNAQAAWARRYGIPQPTWAGYVSGGMTTGDGGAWDAWRAPWQPPARALAAAAELEQLERLATTGELAALR